MKVYYLLVSAFCIWPSNSQFFYSHYTAFPQVNPYFPQTFIPRAPQYHVQPSSPFQGFGYRTDYQDGATSTVFYVTGAESRNLFDFRRSPNVKKEDNTASRARSLASDLTDSNAIPNAERKIESVLQPEDFRKIFDNILPGFVNYYNFPASTVPLALARQLSNSTASEATTTESTTTTTEEPIAAESVINPKVLINHIDNMIKELKTTTEIPTTTTEQKNESTTSSTETSSTLLIEVTDSADETTVETTTQV